MLTGSTAHAYEYVGAGGVSAIDSNRPHNYTAEVRRDTPPIISSLYWSTCTVRKPCPQGELSDAAVIVDETVQAISPFDLPLMV